MNKIIIISVGAALGLGALVGGGIAYHAQSVRADAATVAAQQASQSVAKIEAARVADAKAVATKKAADAVAAHDKAIIAKAVAAAKAAAAKTTPTVVTKTVAPKAPINPPDPYQAAYDAFGFHPGSVCREMFDRGWDYVAMYSWFTSHGYPAHMDVDGDLIPCETVYA
jgi:hypothetical protein